MNLTPITASSQYTTGDPVGKLPYTDLTGRRIGHLTAHRPCIRHHHLCWECRCDCGNWCYRRADMLNTAIRLHKTHVHCAECDGKPRHDWQTIIDDPDYRRWITSMRHTSPRQQ